MTGKLKALSNIQIDKYYQNEPLYGGCFSRDNLPKQIQNKCYIINLDSVKNGGTHWLAVLNTDPKACYYFDSYGIINIPIEIKKFMKTSGKPLKCNSTDLQSIGTSSCGPWCIYMCSNMMKGRQFDDIVNDFTTNPVINEHLLFEHFGNEAFTEKTLNKSIKKHKLNGEGIRQVVDYMKRRAQALSSTVTEGYKRIKGFIGGPRQAQSPLIKTFLANHGNDHIIAIRVCRKPIVGATEIIANILSLGLWEKHKKQLNYDSMFHLFLLLRMDSGSCYRLEKSQNLIISNADWNDNACEFLPVPVNLSMTPNILFENAEVNIDHKKLYVYHPTTSNCQVFVSDILKSSGLLTQSLNDFIMQDAEKILEHLGVIKKLMNGIINVAARGDTLINGEGMNKMILYKPKSKK